MSRINLSKLSLPEYAENSAKIRIIEGHINDLQNNLEVILEAITGKLEELEKFNVH